MCVDKNKEQNTKLRKASKTCENLKAGLCEDTEVFVLFCFAVASLLLKGNLYAARCEKSNVKILKF